MLAQGIKADYACVLLAMDEMFNGDYEGREFIHDLFRDLYNDSGFPHADFYLLEESAPIIQLPKSTWTACYNQGDTYVEFYSRNGDNKRLRVPAHSKVIYFYDTEGNRSHAICIHVSFFTAIVDKFPFAALLLPKNGLIEDYKEYTE